MNKTPSTPTVHPVYPFTLSFDPRTYSHVDNEGNSYVFNSKFLSQFFPPFDSAGVAARVASRTGKTVPEILAEWKATATYGDIVHAHAEARVNGLDTIATTSPDIRQAFGVVDSALEMLSGTYDLLGAEQIVFDPLYRLASRIDLPARNRETGAFAILDWKTNSTVDDRSYGNALPPISHIPDSKVQRFTLELSLSAWLMLDSGYLPPDSAIECACIHVPRGATTPNWIPLPYAGDTIAALVEHVWDSRPAPRAAEVGVLDFEPGKGVAGVVDDENLPF